MQADSLLDSELVTAEPSIIVYDKLDKLIQTQKMQTIQNQRLGTDAGMTSREYNSISRHEDSLCKSNRRSYKS